MLALPWRKYSGENFSIAGRRINCVEVTNDPRGTGLILWDGAFVLAKYLEKRFGPSGFKGKIILELGCGTGLAGISAAALEADTVYLTDLEYALNNTKANVEANPDLAHRIKCVEVDWTKPDLSFLSGSNLDYVLMADVAWVIELVRPLVETCTVIAKRCPQVEFILAHQTRSLHTDETLFGLFQESGFKIRNLSLAEYAEGYDAVNLFLLSLDSTE